jgi:tRNA (guanine6-N2)-methyltransferase
VETVLRLTTNPGLEDVVETELRQKLKAAGLGLVSTERKPFGLAGNVLASLPHGVAEATPVLRTLRSVGHVIEHRAWFTLPEQEPLEALRERLAGLDIPELEGSRSFRVTTVRVGDQDFSTIDVQRAAGAVLLERYGSPVDLRTFDINVRVDVFESLCVVGLQLTTERLDLRHEKVYQPRVTLRPTVAFSMLLLSGVLGERVSRGDRPTRLLDPFCGSGNILLEAADVMPDCEIHGSDYNERAAQGAAENMRAAGAGDRAEVRCLDSRDLAGVWPAGWFDAIITDPPYGIRMGRNVNFHGLYIRFLQAAWTVLAPRGRLVLLVGRQRAAFNRVVRTFGGFRVVHARIVETSGVYPALFVLERLDTLPARPPAAPPSAEPDPEAPGLEPHSM